MATLADEKDNKTVQLDCVEHRATDKTDDDADFLGFVQNATDSERSMSLWEALKLYPKAAAWSVALSSALIMEGYDKAILGNLYAFPSFQKRFGVMQPDGSYQVTAPWQSGLSNGAHVGELFGLLVCGWLSERFGYRKVIMGSLLLMASFIFILFFSPNIIVLEVGYIFIGIPWGVFQTITTTYAAEVCPVALRPYLTTYVNICWVIGQFLAAGILRGFLSLSYLGDWSWRIPYAIQWAFPGPIFIAALLAPESPWWLVRKGRLDDAERSLIRLTSRRQAREEDMIRKTIAMMRYTDEREMEAVAGTSYRDCFRGVNLRRTEIACFVWSIQNLCGNALMGYSTYFYKAAGLPTQQAYNVNLGQTALAIVGTLVSWVCMAYAGRRTLYTGGLVLLNVTLLVIGIISVTVKGETAGWAVGSALLVFVFIYDATIGPVCYAIVAEISSTRLRPKTIVLARSLYNIWGIVVAVLTPYMLNPTAWNWGAKSGFFWFGISTLAAIWCYFRLPEPSGRTFAELDILFERRISARKFKSTHVDVIAGSGNEEKGLCH